ncbi:hypothetical protein HA052_15060 [Chromobacterium haemolyticum]|uniref:Uncharacterized protein n=1 Tax=Chromobacterium fluminis TaxID=3044269 RepID=A0ABX0LDM5_9NEIS|nr:hypothetical protein [Chromobacterium haemolyticum]NHR06510.1 hypothetical protein [Chromobacterium haemolyticum]
MTDFMGLLMNERGDLLDELDVTSDRLSGLIRQIAPLGGDSDCAKEAANRMAQAKAAWTEAFDGSV